MFRENLYHEVYLELFWCTIYLKTKGKTLNLSPCPFNSLNELSSIHGHGHELI